MGIAYGVLWFGLVGRAGVGNPYYSAAIGSGSESLRLAAVGGLDPGGFVTIDKPPAGLWIPTLLTKILGRAPWVLILANAGIALAACVAAALTVENSSRRALALSLGLLSPGIAVLARTTLVDASMLLFGTTALLVLLTRRENLGAVSVGGGLAALALLSKPGAVLMFPALLWVLVRGGQRRRLQSLVAFAGSTILVLAVWVVLAEVLHGDAWFGGSGANRAWEQLFPTSTIDRLVDADLTSLDAQAGTASAGNPGLLRAVTGRMGRQAGALLPLALVSGLFVLKGERPSVTAEAWLIWLGFHAVVYSLLPGLAHAYYAASLVPAAVALIALGGDLVVRWRHGWLVGLLGVVVTVAVLQGVVGVRAGHLLPLLVAVVLIGAAVEFVANVDRAFVLSLLAVPVVVMASLSVETLIAEREASFDPAGGEVVALRLPDLAVVEAELDDLSSVTWSMATSNETLATRLMAEHQASVMLFGGFLGRDAILDEESLSSLVAAGEVGLVEVPRRLVSPADQALTDFGASCTTRTVDFYRFWQCDE